MLPGLTFLYPHSSRPWELLTLFVSYRIGQERNHPLVPPEFPPPRRSKHSL